MARGIAANAAPAKSAAKRNISARLHQSSAALIRSESGIISLTSNVMSNDPLNQYRDQQLERWSATLDAICLRVAELRAPDPKTGELREPSPEEKTMLIHRAWVESFPLTPGR
jgi:hypothetical protein